METQETTLDKDTLTQLKKNARVIFNENNEPTEFRKGNRIIPISDPKVKSAISQDIPILQNKGMSPEYIGAILFQIYHFNKSICDHYGEDFWEIIGKPEFSESQTIRFTFDLED